MRSALLALVLVAFGHPGFSKAESAVRDEGRLLIEASQGARDYSVRRQGIGIVLSYGQAPGAPSVEEVCDVFREAALTRGIPAECFLVPNDRATASFSFVVGDSEKGPFNYENARSEFTSIVALYQGWKRLGYPYGNQP